MKITRVRSLLLAMFTMAIVPSIVHAQFAVYTNLNDYLAAVSMPATDTFDDLELDEFSEFPIARSASNGSTIYSYRAGAPLGTYVVGTDDDSWLSTNEETDILTFDNFSTGVAGVGGFFFGTAFDGAVLPGTELVLTATNSAGSSVVILIADGSTSFRGFVSLNGDVTSLTVLASESFPTVNDLVLGSAPVAVPEPTSFAMIAVGALGLLFTARRRSA